MEENKIDYDTAAKDFENWCDANDIDYDVAGMNAEDKEDFEPLKERIIKEIRKGSAIIDGENIEYTLSNKYEGKMSGMKVKIQHPTGAVFTGMDGYKDTQKMHQLHGSMSAMTGLDVGVFAKMRIRDWKFFQAVLQLFLSV